MARFTGVRIFKLTFATPNAVGSAITFAMEMSKVIIKGAVTASFIFTTRTLLEFHTFYTIRLIAPLAVLD
jgi:hypothetical protein